MSELIMIVDDAPDARALTRATLEDAGYEFLEATGGEQALELLADHDPAACIVDAMMPGMDGIELISRIRDLPGHADTPIVLLTARIDLETANRAREAGADHTFDKMVAPQQLRTKLRELAGGS